MNKTQAHRLLNVARSLRESKNPKLFDMRKYVWGDNLFLFGIEEDDVKKTADVNFCGTPSCAIGHFAGRRDLQKLLKIGHAINLSDPSKPGPMEVQDNDGNKVMVQDELLQNYFGLGVDDLDQLFGAHGCGSAKTPKDAAKYIERFVKARAE